MLSYEQGFILVLKNAIHSGSTGNLLPDTIDWESVFNTASTQNLLPLIYNASSDYPSFAEFDESHPEYMMASMQMLSSQIQRTSEFLDLYKSFLKAGISPVVVKGVVYRSLYGELQDFRISSDEDILIEKDDLEATSAVLTACGYKSGDVADSSLSTIQEITFHNPETNLTIELHLNPFGEDNQIRSKMNSWFRESFNSTETLEVDGVSLRILSPTDNLLFLLFHAFKHFLSAGMGVRMALDILLCMEKYQERIDWDYIKKALDDVNATSFTTDLIAVGNEYLGFDLKIEGLDSPISPDELLEDMLRMGTFGNGSQVDSDASRFTEVAIEGKCSNKLADTFHLVFPSWSQWKGFKPYLVDKPWMLPVEWFKRVGRYLKKKDKVDFSESRKIADRRIELMKKYKVI
ncbi:MAG: nucleotidyltransferase family protein [Oscillospiraceae bacterium]|nr:nucleotidyltransferase family protein [Oscillospiraceae bacterium]